MLCASFSKDLRARAKQDNKCLIRLQIDGSEMKDKEGKGKIEYVGPADDEEVKMVHDLIAKICRRHQVVDIKV